MFPLDDERPNVEFIKMALELAPLGGMERVIPDTGVPGSIWLPSTGPAFT
ncbi:MAG: hypothetical protein LAP87_29430 [Acidobacteriia bacterium]|nr:hypothetical protein [Terriglobia bacterium]